MLTININDVHLEKRIAEKAHSIGKSMQQIVEEMLSNALPEKSEGLYYQKLDPKSYGYFIDIDVDESVSDNDNNELFSYVQDSEKYVENLRKNAWRK